MSVIAKSSAHATKSLAQRSATAPCAEADCTVVGFPRSVFMQKAGRSLSRNPAWNTKLGKFHALSQKRTVMKRALIVSRNLTTPPLTTPNPYSVGRSNPLNRMRFGGVLSQVGHENAATRGHELSLVKKQPTNRKVRIIDATTAGFRPEDKKRLSQRHLGLA
jgi:hypothetical protein